MRTPHWTTARRPVLLSSAPAMKQKHLVSLRDYTRADLIEIFELARRMKAGPAAFRDALRGRTLAMIFQKPSTRTRVSFEAGMYQLGGHALNLGANDIQLRRGETVADTARVLSRYVDGIMARVFSHEDLVEMSRYATIPVINGLSDLSHPVQALADFLTLLERRGRLEGAKVAYVGDGNNVCASLLIACSALGAEVVCATPPGYEPGPGALSAACAFGGNVSLTHDPYEAAAGAQALYTDVWASMGDEDEREQRLREFAGFGVDAALLAAAAPGAVVLHCLPAHVGEEISSDVLYGPQSAVWQQAENRLHVQKALLALLVS
jgi:ornithine carbamoyltransferase